jgi:hypothetical protein
MGSTVMDYVVGRGIGGARTERGRRVWLLVSLAVNLGVLAFFKYYNFFVASAADFLAWIGLPASDWTLKIFLPYGISFYTFQSMSYSIDVYRRRLEPVRSFSISPSSFHSSRNSSPVRSCARSLFFRRSGRFVFGKTSMCVAA